MRKPNPPFEKKRILIVDDEEALLFGLEQLLRTSDIIIDTAPTPNRAIALLNRTTYDFIITDLHLSRTTDVEGLEIIKQARHRNPSTPIVVFTAYGNIEEKNQAETLGATLFLEKPVSPARLRDLITSA